MFDYIEKYNGQVSQGDEQFNLSINIQIVKKILLKDFQHTLLQVRSNNDHKVTY